MKKVNKEFKITSVSKLDILGLEKMDDNGSIVSKFNQCDILNLTKKDMKIIASRMADDYIEQLYWTSLELIVEDYLDKKNK